MAMTFPLTLNGFWNLLPIESCPFDLPEMVQVSRSRGGELMQAEIGTRLWSADVRLGWMLPDEAAEVMPLMQQKNPHPCTIAHGSSLGAFQAANLVFRHPQHFQKLVAFSGRYDLTLCIEAFQDLLDGYYDENVYFHTPSHFLVNLNCGWRLAHLRRMDIVIVVGNEDPFLHNNRQLSDILHGKGVRNQLHIWDGRAHSGKYWRRMASLYV